MDDCTITTIYFDGQFWTALIEQTQNGVLYTGRYVFGAEPSNAQLVQWMLYEWAAVPRFVSSTPVRIKSHKQVKRTKESVSRSLQLFKEAQKVYATEKKAATATQTRLAKKEQYEDKRNKRKEKRRH